MVRCVCVCSEEVRISELDNEQLSMVDLDPSVE